MQADPSQRPPAEAEGGSVVALWRYPVKSMMGEELNTAEVTERGLLGDRRFAVVDASTGKVAGAKNPRKWGNLPQVLSRALGREVAFAEARQHGESKGAQAEEYWPDMEGLDFRDTVTDFELPDGTFFDLAVVHLLTTRRSIVCVRSIRKDGSRLGASGRTSSWRPAEGRRHPA